MPKIHLIVVDGLRPDALALCGDPLIQELLEDSLYTLDAQTVYPSMTLPCHMSLFHSVEPQRHGVTTNVYMPQVRPINGLCEQLKDQYSCAMVYDWEELRDVARPGSLVCSLYIAANLNGAEPVESDRLVAAAAGRVLKELQSDFLFTHLDGCDGCGHDHGWMSEAYLRCAFEALARVRELIDQSPADTLTVILADHGGHDRTHGLDCPEDMTIPVILHGLGLRGRLREGVSILDIAPTITKVLGVKSAKEWEGVSLL